MTSVSIDLIALAIAVLAFGLAVGSLAWQVAAFMLTGGRIKLEPISGLATVTGGGMMSFEPDSLPRESLKKLNDEGYTRPVAGVTVRNVGRMPVTLTGMWVVIEPTDVTYNPLGAVLGPKFSHRLDAGEIARWAVDSSIISAASRAQLKSSGRSGESFTIHIQLGNGKTHKTPRMPIPGS
jgi:hypothetical protein